MAYLWYGAYQHPQNEATVTISKTTLLNEAEQPYAVRHEWSVTGTLHGDDAADVARKCLLLEVAYSFWFRDLVLYDDAGVALHALPNRGSLTGVRVLRPPHYPKGDGGQLSTFRDYAILAAADYPYGAGANPLKSFTETLTFSGGGPRRAVVECANAPPQEQVLRLFTAYRATQSGQAVGMYAYPPVPAPLFGEGKLEVTGRPTFGSPRLKNGLYVDWAVSWDYQFVSATPLVGLPNAWPAGG